MDQTSIPTLGQKIVTALAQKGLTALAAILTTHGLLAASDQAQFTQIGVAVALWGASFVWTWAHETHSRNLTVAALNAPPPATPAK